MARATPTNWYHAEKIRSQGVLAPSLLSADFSKLQEEVHEVETAGASWLHLDVMDGHFVPNLTFGPLVVTALKRHTQLPMDCHLMVSRPEDWVEPFAKAGASLITVHAEGSLHLNRLLHRVADLQVRVGVALNPGTPLAAVEEVLDLVDLVLIMSVNPGFGGQKFIPSSIAKVERLAILRKDLIKSGRSKNSEGGFVIEVDGGVSADNISQLRKAGADVFVAGSAVFDAQNRELAIQKLKEKMR